MSELDFSPSGEAFIIDRSGHLIATSTDEQTFVIREEGQAPTQVQAIHSEDVLTRSTTRKLLTDLHDLQARFKPLTILEIKTDTPEKPLSGVIPYPDEFGLDWLVVVAVPETDFMAEIYANNVRTVLLSLLTFIITSLLGAWTARRITAPISRLNQARPGPGGRKVATASARSHSHCRTANPDHIL